MLILEELEATFGKLDGEILRFAPGLNIITAPNEWGKSTWCAFLMAMLYGVETRSRTTKTEIAEKERYAPWSGKPMSGRMDAVWNGRKIRILRSTAGRIPMGVFQAVDRDTGMLIPELTGQNCGQMLIGVERAVFSRSAFIRQGDMPVGDEENLRRRLHSLVTTGEDRAASLPEKLRQKRNEVRYRRTGLLPQAEQARADCLNN